jgi:pimeloyl-ACP methyl ester carboxylesterase
MFILFRISGISILLWAILAQSCAQFRITDAEAHREFKKDGVRLTTKSIRVGEHNVHFAMTGADTLPTIVFIHGSPGSWSAFDRYMKDSVLLSRFRMISVDRPGFGDSDFGKAQHLEIQSKIISKLFTHWENNRKVYLVGHSLGGPLLIQLNADNPGRFSGLVLISASVDPKEEPKELWRHVADVPVVRFLVPGAFRPSNRELKYFKKDIYTIEDKYDSVRCDVFIIHGTKDQFVPYENVAYAERKLVNAASVETTTIPDANHFIPWTKYEEIRDVLIHMNNH